MENERDGRLINGSFPARPHTVALIGAIEDVINDIATEKMTVIEVIGVLDYVGKRFYDAHFAND